MRVPLVAATEFEIESQESRIKNQDIGDSVTGVGMVATAFALGKHFGYKQL